MKKIISFLSFLSLFSADICFSQSGWFWQNPYPSYCSYQDIKFINSFTGIAVGSNKTIIKTTNKGQTWNTIMQGYSNGDTIFSLFFCNQYTGYASGWSSGQGLILKTTNSGLNWEEQTSGSIELLHSIFFVNFNTGYIVGSYQTLLKTTNGGGNWFHIETGLISHFQSIFFVNENTGFLSGSNGIVRKTTNGGLNWSSMNLSLSPYWINSIYFINQDTGFTSYSWSNYGGLGTVVFKTTNCGSTWSNYIMNGKYSGGRIKFCNSNTGYICGYISFLKTTNCGINWYETIPISLNYTNSLDMINDTAAFAVGQYGNILSGNILTDSFTNISSITEKENQAIIFIDQENGFIAGYGGILKTTNSGNNWQRQISPQLPYFDISFSDSNNGYCCSSNNIIKTTNGGSNWYILSYVSSSCFSILALNKDTVFIVRNGGSVLRSTDGGNDWTSTQISNSSSGICFINSRTGYISGTGNNTLAKTTNTGENWSIITLGLNANPLRIKKLDSLNLYAVASGGVIKSTNGGINWTSYSVSSDYSGDADFINSNTGYFLTRGNYSSMNDKVWMTTNGGLSWRQQLLPYEENNFLNRIKFVNEETGFIIGWGIILKTTNGGIPIGVVQSNKETPISFSLSQNYPNPFNPVTRIKYDIPPSKGARGMMTKLIIYDILGREIETLVNESQMPGRFEVIWDGSRYASGVYFYRLYVDDASAPLSITKKMVLIK